MRLRVRDVSFTLLIIPADLGVLLLHGDEPKQFLSLRLYSLLLSLLCVDELQQYFVLLVGLRFSILQTRRILQAVRHLEIGSISLLKYASF